MSSRHVRRAEPGQASIRRAITEPLQSNHTGQYDRQNGAIRKKSTGDDIWIVSPLQRALQGYSTPL